MRPSETLERGDDAERLPTQRRFATFEKPLSQQFHRPECYKRRVTGVVIGVAIWMAVALLVATVLGRVSKRADSEELGSTRCWDTAEIDETVQHEK